MKFYYVKTEEKYAKAYFVSYEKDCSICDECDEVYAITRKGLYHTRLKGKKQGDFYRAPGCYIGNSKFRGMLKKYEITGYDICDVVVEKWEDQRNNVIDIDTSDLKEIMIKGKSGWYMDKNGNDIKRCQKCGHVDFYAKEELHGISVPEDAWDGSDIFSCSNWHGVMLCTERLKEACEKEKIKNIQFIPLDEFTFA